MAKDLNDSFFSGYRLRGVLMTLVACTYLSTWTKTGEAQRMHGRSVEISQRCQSEIEKYVFLAIRGVQTRKRQAASRCITQNLIDDFSAVGCGCRAPQDAVGCAKRVASKLGFSYRVYATALGSRCDVDLPGLIERNFPGITQGL